MNIKNKKLDYNNIEELIKIIDPKWDTFLSNKRDRIFFKMYNNSFFLPLEGLTEISLNYNKNVNYLNIRLKNSKDNDVKSTLLNNGYQNGTYSWIYKKQVNSLKELCCELNYLEKMFNQK